VNIGLGCQSIYTPKNYIMKKIIVCTMLLIIGTATFSQQIKPSAALTKQGYLKKNKIQKTVANIVLATGTSCVLAAFLIPRGELMSSCSSCFIYDTYYKNDNIRGTFFGIGIMTMLSSIPIYLASHHSKKKAMRLSFKNETVPQLKNSSFMNRPIPSLALKISL
jgi:hypothetical protein